VGRLDLFYFSHWFFLTSEGGYSNQLLFLPTLPDWFPYWIEGGNPLRVRG